MERRTLLRCQIGTGAFFFLNGFVFASWVPHIPAVKSQLNLTATQLGLALMSIVVGGMTAMLGAGVGLRRLPSRSVARLGACAYAIALVFPVLAPSYGALLVALVGFGAASGALDVAMNAEGIALERAARRPVMSSLHALFSLGGLGGSSLAVVLLAAGTSPLTHVASVAVSGLLLVTLLPLLRVPAFTFVGNDGPAFALPTRPLLTLGVVTFVALAIEGIVTDWSSVYMHEAIGLEVSRSGLAYVAFSLTMTVGRLAGDRIVGIMGRPLVLQGGAIVAAVGLAAALSTDNAVLATLGFAFVGLGLSNLIPVLFGAAGSVRGVDAGLAIAAVPTTGYCGFLAGPPVVGAISDSFHLEAAFNGLIVLLAGMALVARRLPALEGERR